MNLVFCSDQNYLPHLASAIHSILAHHAASEIVFWVVHNDCSEASLQTFNKAVSPARISLLCDESLTYKTLFVNRHVSKTTYQRLFLDHILPAEVTRYLYLDCDLLVVGNLRQLYDMPLDGYILAAAPEYDPEKLFAPDRKSEYFNAGVMLVNRDAWRINNIGEALEHYLGTHGEKLRFWDQDALNGVLANVWKPVSPKWNLTASYFRNQKMRKAHRADEVYADCRIIHFNASIKPWHYRLRHPYKYLYFTYLPKHYKNQFKYSDKNLLTVTRKQIALILINLGLKDY